MNFFKLLGRFIPLVKWRIIVYILLNIVSSLCSAFTFMAIVPLLNVLFGISDSRFSFMDPATISSYSEAIDVALNNIMFRLQEQINISGPLPTLAMIGGFVVLMSFLANVISYFAYWVRIPIRTGISRDLRRDAYSRIIRMKLTAFSDSNRGDFVARMTNDVEEIEYGIGSTLDMLIKDPVAIIVFIVAMAGISAPLTWSSMLLVLIGSMLILLLGRRMRTISFKAQTLRGRILSIFEQSVGGIQTIKAFNAEDGFEARFSKLNDETRATFNKQNRFYSLAWPCTDFLLICIIVLVLYIGGSFIFAKESPFTASQLIAFLAIFYSMISPMRDMMKCTFGIRKAMASVDRLEKVNGLEQESDSGTELSGQDSESIVSFKGVSFSYGEKVVLSDVSFSIPRGKKSVIVGNTGSGKTTIAKLIMKFIRPDKGDYYFNGEDAFAVRSGAIRQKIGYISQEPVLFNDSVFNNIAFANEGISRKDVEKVCESIGLDKVIKEMENGYDTIIGDRGTKLSGGQKQCICIARTLLSGADFLILDEATNSLDIMSEKMVKEAIEACSQGMTILEITHQVDTMLRADWVIALEKGHVIEEGAPSELAKRDGYVSRISGLYR